MKAITRRRFLSQSAAGLAAAAATGVIRSRSVVGAAQRANDAVVLALVGAGGRGTALAEGFSQLPNVSFKYVCDVETPRGEGMAKKLSKAGVAETQIVGDIRRALDDKDVDGLIVATPEHWHALATVWACQAGKDVYVEKNVALTIWEGRKMIEAARKYKRVVQVGMQTRSSPYAKDAVEQIRSGKLGDVHAIRVFNMMQHPMMKEGSVQPIPEGFDYDLWCGPAPKLPYNPSRSWLNQWEYSCGPIPGDLIHQLDFARMLIGDKPCPSTVAHAGGVHALKDGREIPDTQFALYEYGDLTLICESALWTPYMKKIPTFIRDNDLFPDWPFCATRIEVLGTKGFMYVGRHGGGWQIYDSDDKVIDHRYGRQGDKWHQDNFIECIRTREKPNADVEQGHYSALLCHMANISCRVGNRKLTFDPKAEAFVDAPDANKYLKRTYRQPWVVPDQV